jgi:opacity protein-like surface antigen
MTDTARVESDPSRQIWTVNLRGTYDVTSHLQMYLQYGIWFSDYTTSNSIADDPYHAERDDTSQSIDCHVNYDLTKNAEIFLAYRYTIKDASPATNDLSILDAAILGYERHQVSFSVKYSF